LASTAPAPAKKAGLSVTNATRRWSAPSARVRAQRMSIVRFPTVSVPTFGAFYFLVSAIWLTVSEARRKSAQTAN